MLKNIAIIAVSALALAACQDQADGGGAGSRDQIKAVGSSTVYPFATLAAEQFVNKTPGAKAPVIEATGTGAGVKLFCAGVGAAHPDILNASRRMKLSEFKQCEANGVDDILEIQIGLDGIAFAEAANGPKLQLTPVDLFKALAINPMGKKNVSKTWKEINPALPAMPIQIYGPPSTSGTRDALTELIMAKGCEAIMPQTTELKDKDPDGYKAACNRVREDGVYIDAGENDNLIVQKLQSNPNAIGIFGYSYLEANKDKLVGVPLNGVSPTYETIAANRYPGSRPLYIYVKKAHLSAIKGLRDYVKQFGTMWEPNGPLAAKGLIASPANVRAAATAAIKDEPSLDANQLS